MAHILERMKARRVMAVSAVALLLLIGAVAIGMSGGKAEAPTGEQSVTVAPAPFVLTVSFSGRVAPGERIDLSVPFDARVARVFFEYGDQVEAGQKLLELDAADVTRSHAEAESAWLKANSEAERLNSWESGVEVRRAARAVAAAEADMADLETKIAETKALLDRGLVPRSEYEGLLQQRRQREAALVSSREDSAETLRRVSSGERRVALMERDVAGSQYAIVRAGGGGVVRAPLAGVIVRPEARGEGGDTGVRMGGRVTKGQSLGVVASTGGLDVIFTLDEADLNTVQPGQKAVITGPGFGGLTLPGIVSGVAGEAKTDAGAGKATFEARVRLDPLSVEASRNIRIGMTATISIVAYESANAFSVPPEAVQGAAPNAFVMVRGGAGSAPQQRPIVVGRVGPASVEVWSGLKTGDVVVWTSPPAS